MASAYLIWLTVSPILRYAVSIEVLLGVIISISTIIGSRAIAQRWCEIIWIIGMSFLVVEAAKHTTYPRWGRLLPYYHDVVLRIDPIKIALNSLVLLLGPPEAYAVPSIAAENPTAQLLAFTIPARSGTRSTVIPVQSTVWLG